MIDPNQIIQQMKNQNRIQMERRNFLDFVREVKYIPPNYTRKSINIGAPEKRVEQFLSFSIENSISIKQLNESSRRFKEHI